MLNYIWGFMIIIGIIYGAITGHMAEITNAALDSAKDAVSLCITMVGVTALWVGLMEIATDAGLVSAFTRKIQPFISFMFPKIPKNHKSREHISTNIIANILGLGWAATPAGLMAMEELANLEKERAKEQEDINKFESKVKKSKFLKKMEDTTGVASDEMCTFLVINISSLQLIPVNIIAYRSQYGSVNPAAVIVPCIIATIVSTTVGIIYCKIKCKHN